MRDGISDGFLTRPAHDSHPVDLMCLYLLHGSLERIPGLPADRETLSFEQLSSHVRAEHRSGSPFGAPVDLSRFMHHLRGHHAPAGAPGDWDFGVVTDARDLRESVVRFGNGREVWFQVGDHRAEWFRGGTGGRLPNGRSRSAWNRGRLVTGRPQDNRFGTQAPAHAGGVMFPVPLAAVADDTPEARADRRWVARLRGPFPLRVGRTVRPGFGAGRRPR
ncbi:hypothetical protein ABZ517_13795 [Streptomyces scabiei]|uniref:hypothetical protein n=1 Tax=Streptomyces scabiei TaxID=1930 RepID=UPI003410FB56